MEAGRAKYRLYDADMSDYGMNLRVVHATRLLRNGIGVVLCVYTRCPTHPFRLTLCNTEGSNRYHQQDR